MSLSVSGILKTTKNQVSPVCGFIDGWSVVHFNPVIPCHQLLGIVDRYLPPQPVKAGSVSRQPQAVDVSPRLWRSGSSSESQTLSTPIHGPRGNAVSHVSHLLHEFGKLWCGFFHSPFDYVIKISGFYLQERRHVFS
ncbi:hypothetical protein PAAG_11962 [Paracoccidioides lutzii Pb01]|uniref:Uncharacterized protein n=1 Tax=Paracoccidioides lutzii (strain ATCC MYA-826 / Pb01) TaxID=502779 RepID=A0A0A2V0P1_PARBA|nr:hypothetical protein PAAG_11962 [Paracoccidioides lutzii Pb01]KGQ01381.1 hypothetical protein PAAG_11962 [Paracoccidioides lutzii Pb01]